MAAIDIFVCIAAFFDMCLFGFERYYFCTLHHQSTIGASEKSRTSNEDCSVTHSARLAHFLKKAEPAALIIIGVMSNCNRENQSHCMHTPLKSVNSHWICEEVSDTQSKYILR